MPIAACSISLLFRSSFFSHFNSFFCNCLSGLYCRNHYYLFQFHESSFQVNFWHSTTDGSSKEQNKYKAISCNRLAVSPMNFCTSNIFTMIHVHLHLHTRNVNRPNASGKQQKALVLSEYFHIIENVWEFLTTIHTTSLLLRFPNRHPLKEWLHLCRSFTNRYTSYSISHQCPSSLIYIPENIYMILYNLNLMICYYSSVYTYQAVSSRHYTANSIGHQDFVS